MQTPVALTSPQTAACRHLAIFAPTLRWARFGPNRRQAARAAVALSRIVDRDLVLVRAMPLERRARQADRLAAIVLLAQAYRHFANGWIGRRELRRRLRSGQDELIRCLQDGAGRAPRSIHRLDVIRSPRG